jgi:hypothetical protein
VAVVGKLVKTIGKRQPNTKGEIQKIQKSLLLLLIILLLTRGH